MATDRTARSPKGGARRDAITTTSWGTPPEHLTDPMADDVVLEMGWGRLIFGQTFSDHAGIEAALRDERLGRRDIALYMRDPHILVSRRPQDLFVRSEEHTSELQSLMRISYAAF